MKRSHGPILDVSSLTILRDRNVILDEVTWTVRPGEHWVLLGANGSGKTSLLSALTGYLMPTRGEIRVLGQRYGESDWRELRTRIGIVSSALRQLMPDHETALDAVVSGRQAVVDLWGSPTRAEARAGRQLLESVDAGPLAHRPWAVLSQGERQRVLIARALMARPRLLILDEPCAGLDPVAREHFLQFLERVGRQPNGPALVLVTHHVEEITPAFRHVLMLRGGRVVAAGRRTKVLNSRNLSAMFGAPVRLGRFGRRHVLNVGSKSARVM
ncbi:MAG: ABC transporter ATP-binding protein [Verrucomicrobiales bacterium]|nr:ABC transporter ATP-binding protein [Verrucomicrobiales bacterium]